MFPQPVGGVGLKSEKPSRPVRLYYDKVAKEWVDQNGTPVIVNLDISGTGGVDGGAGGEVAGGGGVNGGGGSCDLKSVPLPLSSLYNTDERYDHTDEDDEDDEDEYDDEDED